MVWFGLVFGIIVFIQIYIGLQRVREVESAVGNEHSLYDLGRQVLAFEAFQTLAL